MGAAGLGFLMGGDQREGAEGMRGGGVRIGSCDRTQDCHQCEKRQGEQKRRAVRVRRCDRMLFPRTRGGRGVVHAGPFADCAHAAQMCAMLVHSHVWIIHPRAPRPLLFLPHPARDVEHTQ